MRINFNRSDRELAMLKEDYKRLYDAYYKFDDKIKLIICQDQDAYWSEDSSAYLIGSAPHYYFGFINKPTMKTAFYIWESTSINGNKTYVKQHRVDTIRPHELSGITVNVNSGELLIAPVNVKDSALPDMSKLVGTILLK